MRFYYFLSWKMSKLLLATNNLHKIKEIKDILKGSSIEILSAKDFEDFPEIDENGETLEENASIKAKSNMGDNIVFHVWLTTPDLRSSILMARQGSIRLVSRGRIAATTTIIAG